MTARGAYRADYSNGLKSQFSGGTEGYDLCKELTMKLRMERQNVRDMKRQAVERLELDKHAAHCLHDVINWQQC